MLEDGSTIKLKTVPVYDECDNGELIKTGEYSEISFMSESKIPNVDGIDYIESLDELVELTDEEYNSLLNSVNLTEIEEIPLEYSSFKLIIGL